MKLTYLFLMLCLPSLLIAEETIKISRKMNGNVRVENYEILKSTRLVHGYYQQLFHDRILEDGYYNNGLKDSIWQNYNLKGELVSIGKYKDDKQVGIWNFYIKNGTIELSYDFSNQKLLYFLPEEQGKEQKYKILIDNELKEVVLDRIPLYLGGSEKINKSLMLDVKVPIEAFESGKSGKVVVKISINEKGEVFNYEITKSYGYGLDEEVLRVIKKFQHWLPAIYKGMEIATSLYIPYNLKMN